MGFIYDAVAREIAHVIALISPRWANEYKRHHDLLKRGYSAAKTTGPGQRWNPSKTSSAAGEIKSAWSRVTAKARDLDRNNAYVIGMGRKFLAGVVSEGMWPKAKAADDSGALLVDINREIEHRWEAWEESAQANGSSYCELQRLVANHLRLDGECLVRRVALPGRPLALQVLECDHLDSGRDADTTSGGGRIIQGIEQDAYGKPVAYWLFPNHPGDKSSTSVRVPADQVLHIFDRDRASQVRGISLFASVISELQDTAEFQDSTLILARVATAYGLFIQSPFPEDHFGTGTGSEAESGAPTEYVEPGAIRKLLPGETIQSVKPENPGAIYDPFVRSRLRAASVGTPLSYETFSNDYSQATYSSARQAMLIERALFRFYSGLIDRRLNWPVYRWFIETQTRLGDPANGYKPLSLPQFDKNPRRYFAVKFSRPRQEWIDPAKESKAAETRLSIGVETLTEIAENEGRDIEEIFATRAAEIARMKELGIFGVDAHVEQFGQQEPASTGDENNDDQNV